MRWPVKFLWFVALVLISCGKTSVDGSQNTLYYTEQHRPQIHFSPQANWMNDPNGMFYLDGEYHLFYQYYPDSTVWGPMHWGHAVTTDLVHWEHLPIALYPDSLGYIFSGSAVVDTNNTSGFGSKENPPVVAIFTYHDAEGERAGRNDYQTQGLAYSLDKGRTWTKYDQNPVLKNPGIRDFRDPKVSWIDEAKQWIMTLAVTDHIEFYGSGDLKSWNKLSEFGKTEGAHGGVWECPDLFKLTDDQGISKFVLLVSINPGAPNGGSGTQYFIGDFDGKKFTSDKPGKNSGWIDYGTDNYAGVTWSDIPANDGRRIFIGWMSNWLYAEKVPTKPWRSAMTIPRVLTLVDFEGNYLVKATPVIELNQLVTRTITFDGDLVVELNTQDSLVAPMMISGKIRKEAFALEFSNSRDQILSVGYDTETNQYFIDRDLDMPLKTNRQFAPRAFAPRLSNSEDIAFVAIVDVASIEMFFDDGRTNMTSIVFPEKVFTAVTLSGAQGKLSVSNIQVKQLRAIW